MDIESKESMVWGYEVIHSFRDLVRKKHGYG